jgi:hypothetical protein
LVLLARLVDSEIAFFDVLLMLLALVLHLFCEPLAEFCELGGIATLVFEASFELVHALLKGLHLLLRGLPSVERLRMSLLELCKRSTSCQIGSDKSI